jgi:hypothetical protein
MPTSVLLPHGKTIDLDAVAVIRSVSPNESQRFNERMATMPGGTGIISDRRWTVALEVQGEKGIQTRYTADVTVAELITRLGDAAKRFKTIDAGNAAIDRSAKVVLIRPLGARDGSDKQAIVHIDGGSSNGLMVTTSAADIRAELGSQASHLRQVGDEGFVDTARIKSVSKFDPDKDLAEGQQRFATAVQFEGVYRPQYFRAEAHDITGATVIDTRKAPDAAAARSGAQARAAAGRAKRPSADA